MLRYTLTIKNKNVYEKVKLILLSMVVLIEFASCSSGDDNGPKIQEYTATLNQSNNLGVAGVSFPYLELLVFPNI